MSGLRRFLVPTLAAAGLVALSDCKPSSSFTGANGTAARTSAKKPGSGSGPVKGDDDDKGTKGDPVTIPVGSSKSSTDLLPKDSKIEGCESENTKIVTCDPKTGELKGIAPGEALVKVKTPDGEKELYVKVTPVGGKAGSGSDTGSGKLGSNVDGVAGSGSTGAVDNGTGIKGKPDPGGLLIDDGGAPCLDKLMPLHIMIALDVTGSMDDNIDAVRTNILAFAQTVKTIVPEGAKGPIPDVKIGAITYVDDAGDQQQIALTDPASFASQMSGVGTRGFIHDHCEGGINAARRAMEVLAAAQAAEPGGAIPMILVISDNYSHDSMNGEGSRTFDMSSVMAAAQAPQFKNMLFFDAVPTTTDVPLLTECPGAPLSAPPAAQWEPVRLAWKATHPDSTVSPGRNLGFPFTGSTLLSTLPQELKRLLKVCSKP